MRGINRISMELWTWLRPREPETGSVKQNFVSLPSFDVGSFGLTPKHSLLTDVKRSIEIQINPINGQIYFKSQSIVARFPEPHSEA